ncbi:MAG: 5'-methylthioadenosine/S-adenosylhomocysteine nucleosidase [Clostridia bacterium]|jgi:adenosylhomocysteine nucleosidase|nr:5'-methylthioadenosine/S-adenosylhomocysteine nucleosidase [Clostridia bacterium]
MKIGLLIAISRELESFLKYGKNPEEETVAGRTVYKTQMEGHEIYAVQSGWGEIDAASATAMLIVKYECDLIMNFGVTGALEKGLKVEDLFIVEKALHYDFDVSPIDPVKKGQYADYPDEYIPLDAEIVRRMMETVPGLRKVTVASGDKFVEDREEKIRLRNLGCHIVDMEIAAIARVCERSGVRCMSIKCISDTFEGDGGDFNTNVRNAADKAFSVIRKAISVAGDWNA